MLNAQWMLDSGGEKYWKMTTWTSTGKQLEQVMDVNTLKSQNKLDVFPRLLYEVVRKQC